MEVLSPLERICLILLLLGCANTMPIVARKIFRQRWELSVDFGMRWMDGRPVFGPHKTWRGLAASLGTTTLLSLLTPAGPGNGFLLALLSMTGDLLASFMKRRMNLRSGARATGLDQGVEALLPLVCLRQRLFLSWQEIALITILFAAVELVVSPLLYRLGIRRNPH